MAVSDYRNIDIVSPLRQYCAFDDAQKIIIRTFITTTGETEPFTDWLLHLPEGHTVWFYRKPMTPDGQPHSYFGFLWAQVQSHEKGSSILRVHALYIHPRVLRHTSKIITKTFEGILTSEAKLRGIKEIGFYTKRDPDAFMRRLNRTAPASAPWMLDSYVITRKVP